MSPLRWGENNPCGVNQNLRLFRQTDPRNEMRAFKPHKTILACCGSFIVFFSSSHKSRVFQL